MLAWCSLFETSIRYVGGMISAYELSGKQHQILVQQAQQLVDKMVFAWADPVIDSQPSRCASIV